MTGTAETLLLHCGGGGQAGRSGRPEYVFVLLVLLMYTGQSHCLIGSMNFLFLQSKVCLPARDFSPFSNPSAYTCSVPRDMRRLIPIL